MFIIETHTLYIINNRDKQLVQSSIKKIEKAQFEALAEY